MKKLFLLLAAWVLNTPSVSAFQAPAANGDAAKISQINANAAGFLAKNQLNEAENAAHEALELALKQGSGRLRRNPFRSR